MSPNGSWSVIFFDRCEGFKTAATLGNVYITYILKYRIIPAAPSRQRILRTRKYKWAFRRIRSPAAQGSAIRIISIAGTAYRDVLKNISFSNNFLHHDFQRHWPRHAHSQAPVLLGTKPLSPNSSALHSMLSKSRDI